VPSLVRIPSRKTARRALLGAALALTLATRCQAILKGRCHVIPQDVKDVAGAVLAHRLVPAFEADARGLSAADLVNEILQVLKTP
jgi:MoxR-like ATPase